MSHGLVPRYYKVISQLQCNNRVESGHIYLEVNGTAVFLFILNFIRKRL